MFRWLQDTPPHTLTDLQRVARFLYLQQHAFGGKVDGQSRGTATTAPPLNLLRIKESLSAAHLRLFGPYIENLDWHKCMERYDRRTRCFTWTCRTGRRLAMVWTLSSSNTRRWLS